MFAIIDATLIYNKVILLTKAFLDEEADDIGKEIKIVSDNRKKSNQFVGKIAELENSKEFRQFINIV